MLTVSMVSWAFNDVKNQGKTLFRPHRKKMPNGDRPWAWFVGCSNVNQERAGVLYF